MPCLLRAGWGFAALNTADEKLDHDGTPRVELGAVLWAEFVDPVKK